MSVRLVLPSTASYLILGSAITLQAKKAVLNHECDGDDCVKLKIMQHVQTVPSWSHGITDAKGIVPVHAQLRSSRLLSPMQSIYLLSYSYVYG